MSSDAERIMAQAVDLCVDIHSILLEAYGYDLDGSERGPLVSSHYLARIRNLLRGYTPVRPAPICATCIELRWTLRNIYHLTLNYQDARGALIAVREASGPGAPAPARGSNA